jgi:ferric-dicitrate binding protein FerR (iron transport regulator)
MRDHVSPDGEITPLRLLHAEATMPAEVHQRIVQGSLQRQQRRRRLRRLAWIAAPCAAAAAAGLVLWLARAPGPSVDIAPPALAVALTPAPAAVHETGASATHLALGPHRADIAPRSRLERMPGQGADVDLVLTTGKVELTVAPLPAGHGFRVATEAALVEVVGTRFTVAIEDGCTWVAVSEGVVRVTPASSDSDELRAGARRTYCGAGAGESHEAGERWVRAALVQVSEGRDLGRATTLLERYLAHHADGVFAEDAMFHLALLYRGQGRDADAARLTQRFLERFPDSARAERLRRAE